METVKDTNGNHVDVSAAFDEALKGHAHEERKERANGKHRAGKHGKLVRASDRGKYSLVKNSLAASGIEDALARLAFNETDEHWYFYQNGLWEAISDQKARNLIDAAIEQETYVPEGQFGYNCSYVDGVRTQLKRPLGLELNAAPRHLLPFQNGVLDLTTQTLRACSIEDGFTWRLPFDYDPQARCGAFKNWLSWTVGDDPGLVSLLRAFIKAVILGRADFQRYLELIGPGGSGKGTLTRVIEALMGAGNVHVTELKHLEGNRFETAG